MNENWWLARAGVILGDALVCTGIAPWLLTRSPSRWPHPGGFNMLTQEEFTIVHYFGPISCSSHQVETFVQD